MATVAWRKLKKALKSKLSLFSSSHSSTISTSSSNSKNTATTTTSGNALSSAAPTPPLPKSSSSSFSSRLSRSFTLHTSSRTCAICLRSLKKGQGQAIFYAECSHPFHFSCIADNVKHGNLICPICRCKWKDVPFPGPANVSNLQNHDPGQAQISSNYSAPLVPPDQLQSRSSAPLPQPPEPERYSDDEELPPLIVSDQSSYPSQHAAISVKTFLEYPAVSASEAFLKFGVLFRISAPPLDSTLPDHHRAPIDIVTVLDVSGSMASKLNLLKRAVNFIIQNLGPSDRLSILTFSSSAQRILPLKRMSPRGRENATSVVNSLSASGRTNIVAGLMKGVRVLEERRRHNSVASVILLSDGCDTENYNKQNKPEYMRLLRTSICPSNGPEEFQEPTFPVHTFGFGLDHDAAAMHAISDASGGTFSFIESINALQDAFARCIGGLLSIVAKEVQLKVKSVSPGVRICSIPSGRHKNKISDQGDEATIEIGNLYADEQKEFLAYLSVPATSSPAADGEETSETTSLMDISCLHKDPVSQDIVQGEGARITIRRPHLLSPTDQILCLEVDRQRNRVLVTEAIAETQKMAETGDLKGAQALLAKQISTLLSTASAQAGDDLCNRLEAELRETRERMESIELYERHGRPYILSGMSSHSWQRAATRGHSTTVSSDLSGSYETPSMTTMILKSQTGNFSRQT